MPWNELLTTVRTEIAAAEHRASIQAGTVRTLFATEIDTAKAEQALFHELDGLALLRAGGCRLSRP
jgi:hypothetical protein